MTIDCMAGKILIVDLSEENIYTEEIPDELVKKYIGSRGIAAKILWDETGKDTDPLGPENVLIFSVGPLAGTFALCSGRTTVTTKSPATNMYLKTNGGGHWAPNLKFAGYDLVVLKGKAEKPVYLYIDDSEARLVDAEHLWGKDVRQATEMIQKENDDPRMEVACIGQAGENFVRFAGIFFSIYSTAARGGSGAVMGSKNLKAIAVGSSEGVVKVANPGKFKKTVEKMRDLVLSASLYEAHCKYGTSGIVEGANEGGNLGIKNYSAGPFKGAGKLSGIYLDNEGYLKGRIACDACLFGCHRYTEFKDGYSGGPEFETLAALGCAVCIDDTDAVLKANELCNIYGLDTISTGSVIQWAVESFEKGVITEKDTDGLKLEWGNGEMLLEIIKRITFRQNIGNLLAEGIKIAARKVGQGSEKWAVQARGLEQSRMDTRVSKGYALAFALNPRGPDHLHTEAMAEMGMTIEGRKCIEKITGSEEYANPYITEKRAEIVAWHEDVLTATEVLGLCIFLTSVMYTITTAELAELFTYGTGIEIDETSMTKAAERILTLEQCYNIKLGKKREWHKLPWRLMNEKPPVDVGSTNTKEELDGMLDEYFDLRDWDKETSFPKLSKLSSLDLDDIAAELQEMGIELR